MASHVIRISAIDGPAFAGGDVGAVFFVLEPAALLEISLHVPVTASADLYARIRVSGADAIDVFDSDAIAFATTQSEFAVVKVP